MQLLETDPEEETLHCHRDGTHNQRRVGNSTSQGRIRDRERRREATADPTASTRTQASFHLDRELVDSNPHTIAQDLLFMDSMNQADQAVVMEVVRRARPEVEAMGEDHQDRPEVLGMDVAHHETHLMGGATVAWHKVLE